MIAQHEIHCTQPAAFWVSGDGTVIHTEFQETNLPASNTGIQVEHRTLKAKDPKVQQILLQAIQQAAQSSHRKLVVLQRHPALRTAIVRRDESSDMVVVQLDQQSVCDTVTIQCFAEGISLTNRETEILHLLARGLPPKSIARRFDTSVATVRTQIRGLLAKSAQHSMRDLMLALAKLPRSDNSLGQRAIAA